MGRLSRRHTKSLAMQGFWCFFPNIGAPKRLGPVRWKMAQPAPCRIVKPAAAMPPFGLCHRLYIFVAGWAGRYGARGRRVPLPARAAGDAKRLKDGGPPDAFANGCPGDIGLPRCRAGKRGEAGAALRRQKGAHTRLYRPAPSLCSVRRLAEGKTHPEARRSPFRDAAAVRRRIPVRTCVPYRLYCSLTSEAAAFRADERRCRESRGRREATRNSGRSLRPARRRGFGERKNTSAVRLSAGGAIPPDGAAEKPSGGLRLLGSTPITPYYRYSTNPAGRPFSARKRPALLSAGRYWRWGSFYRRPATVRLGRRYSILFIRYKRCFIKVYNPKRGQGVPPPPWGTASGGRADGSGVPMRYVL